MLNLKTGKHFTDAPNAPKMTRGGFLRGIIASGIAPSITMGAIANAGSANASVGGMMRNVGARNATMFGEKLPYDAEVEWLENTGVETIYTDILVYPSDIIKINLKGGLSLSQSWVFGSDTVSTGVGGISLSAWDGSYVLGYGGGYAFGKKFQEWNGLYEINNGVLYANGVNVASGYLSFTPTIPISLFGYNRNGTRRLSLIALKMASFEIVGRHNFIPVRVGNVGYMYDRVSGKLFGNSGTGNFILGPDKI